MYISCWLKSLDKNQEEIGELEIGEVLSEKNIYIYIDIFAIEDRNWWTLWKSMRWWHGFVRIFFVLFSLKLNIWFVYSGKKICTGKSRDRPVLIKLHDETGRQSVTSVTRTIFIIIRASISLLRSFSHYLQSLSFSRFNVLSFLINVAANVTFFFFFFLFLFLHT